MVLNTLEPQDQNFLKRKGVWDKIRETFAIYFGSEGDAIDKSWTARLQAEIDVNNKSINLFALAPFIRDWINSNYRVVIEKQQIVAV